MAARENETVLDAYLESTILLYLDIPYFLNNPWYLSLWRRYYEIKKDAAVLFLMFERKVGLFGSWLYVELYEHFQRQNCPSCAQEIIREGLKSQAYPREDLLDKAVAVAEKKHPLEKPARINLFGREWVKKSRLAYDSEAFLVGGYRLSFLEYKIVRYIEARERLIEEETEKGLNEVSLLFGSSRVGQSQHKAALDEIIAGETTRTAIGDVESTSINVLEETRDEKVLQTHRVSGSAADNVDSSCPSRLNSAAAQLNQQTMNQFMPGADSLILSDLKEISTPLVKRPKLADLSVDGQVGNLVNNEVSTLANNTILAPVDTVNTNPTQIPTAQTSILLESNRSLLNDLVGIVDELPTASPIARPDTPPPVIDSELSKTPAPISIPIPPAPGDKLVIAGTLYIAKKTLGGQTFLVTRIARLGDGHVTLNARDYALKVRPLPQTPEIELSRRLKANSHCIPLEEVFESSCQLLCLFPYLEMGSLKTAVLLLKNQYGHLPEVLAAHYIHQLLRISQDLAQQGISLLNCTEDDFVLAAEDNRIELKLASYGNLVPTDVSSASNLATNTNTMPAITFLTTSTNIVYSGETLHPQPSAQWQGRLQSYLTQPKESSELQNLFISQEVSIYECS
ncbi:hypothetical protein NEHOM01_1989 [Nematocida homosporus]|uniref:uncharacterized protein n=1 Tax=Nematocida homosporus TaxID=1912981 RepID=UPI0022211BC4|nr:uncharacterized protein NEHOM01_1989 [Nematocida homosporus]KAI5187180.1 hypothetical protein NEHOM01_1989 [Nematocida homosporus]